jgi:hypothetical protein
MRRWDVAPKPCVVQLIAPGRAAHVIAFYKLATSLSTSSLIYMSTCQESLKLEQVLFGDEHTNSDALAISRQLFE